MRVRGVACSTLTGAVFPAYKSFKALRTNDEEETQKWLKYWVIYSLFIVAQFPADIILTWSARVLASRLCRR